MPQRGFRPGWLLGLALPALALPALALPVLASAAVAGPNSRW